MTRRYLSQYEVSSATQRGKRVDSFLGAGDISAEPTIRYLSVRGTAEQVTATLWEVEDPRNPDFLDVDSLYPPNGGDAPVAVFVCTSVQEALTQLDERFPGVAERFVNQGVIGDEYADYLAK